MSSSTTTTEPIGDVSVKAAEETSSRRSVNYVDANLLSLKCLLFFFFGGIMAIFLIKEP